MVTITPERERLAVGCSKAIIIYDLKTGQRTSTVEVCLLCQCVVADGMTQGS